MLKTFRSRTSDAYGYSMVDAVNTLLVQEQMEKRDRDLYQAFGFSAEDTPPLRPTLGSRISTFLTKDLQRQTAGSSKLPSVRGLHALMRKGGMDLFAERPGASKYGEQTGRVHGGLLVNRSPTRFWHQSEGMLRDVDMGACYSTNLMQLNAYWGRPVILEPVENSWTLAQAIDFVTKHADRDGWMIRATGNIQSVPNVLIPSGDNAVTSANYRTALRRGKRRKRERQPFIWRRCVIRGPYRAQQEAGSTQTGSNLVW
jgi:hypothetical protein